MVGLYAAFLVGLITAVLGGRPGMISGATGALAVVMVALVAQHGVEYLFATVGLMGILQVIAVLALGGLCLFAVSFLGFALSAGGVSARDAHQAPSGLSRSRLMM